MRRQLRGPNLPRQNQFDRTSVPNLQQQNPPGRPGAPQQPNPNRSKKAILPRRIAVAARERD
jgi:hypothetical protein